MKYQFVIVGGTFDHLHLGHQAILEKAFFLGQFVLIGLSTKKLYQKKFLWQTIEDYKLRKKNLEKFIRQNFVDYNLQNLPIVDDSLQKKGFKIVPIDDYLGGADKLKEAEAIVVSALSFPNALKINQLRVKNGLKELKIVVVPEILASDDKIISSERIRKGEIGRKGESYWLQASGCLKDSEKIILPENLKEELRKPLGEVFSETRNLIKAIKEKKPVMIITIGDIVSYHLIKNNIIPDLAIFDLKTRREKVEQVIEKTLKNNRLNKIVNQPGTISKEAFLTIKKAIQIFLTKNQKQKILIEGEEDLLALPSILFSPLKTLVFYGHWQLGVVGVLVDEVVKRKIIGFLRTFLKN
jgi:cytidyltransferase-like protein